MDIFSFINSRDIQNYLKEQDYKFSVPECAWLIKQSKNTTIEERHRAWNEIIQTMPDCEVESVDPDAPPQKSLHAFLRKYMEIETSLLDRFYKDEQNAAYVYKSTYEWSCGDCWDSRLFPSYQACVEDAKRDGEVIFVQFGKTYIDGRGVKMEMITTLDLVPISITPGKDLDDGDLDILYHDFWTIVPYFPTPFSEGDILEYAHGRYESVSNRDIEFVMTNRNVNGGYLHSCGPSPLLFDTNKLNFYYHGYTIDENFNLSHIRYYWYMDLEIANDNMNNFDSRDSFLSSVSSYLKGDTDLPDLLNAQKYANS